jgi:hypothetical protein
MLKIKKEKIIRMFFLLSLIFMACQYKKNNIKSGSDDSKIKSMVDNKYMEKILIAQLNRGQSKSFGEQGLDIPIANEKFDISDFEVTVEIDKKNSFRKDINL